MLMGEKVNLRALEPADLDSIMQWVNDREVTKWLAGFVWPVSRKSEEEWLARATKADNPNDRVLVVEAKDGVYIGQVGLHQIDYTSGVAELGIVLGRKDYWGKGYGTDAIRTLLRFAFSQLRLRKIILKYQGANERGRKCYSRIGFKEVGCLKAHQLIDGEFQDMVYMEIFAEEFGK
jgi:RimJ/RimL family protein N-acetyltransferase